MLNVWQPIQIVSLSLSKHLTLTHLALIHFTMTFHLHILTRFAAIQLTSTFHTLNRFIATSLKVSLSWLHWMSMLMFNPRRGGHVVEHLPDSWSSSRWWHTTQMVENIESHRRQKSRLSQCFHKFKSSKSLSDFCSFLSEYKNISYEVNWWC